MFVHYLKNSYYVASNIAFAFCFSLLLKNKFPKLLTNKNLTIFAIVSSALLYIAALGGVGWLIQTYDGQTPAENLDKILLLSLVHIGGFLLFTYLISTAWKKKESQQSKPLKKSKNAEEDV